MNTHPFVKQFIALVDSWNAAGWGEVLLWETLEGLRPKPWKYGDPLTPEQLEMCRALRDDLKVWPCWHAEKKVWNAVDIEVWRAFTPKADDVRMRLDNPHDPLRT